MSGGSLDYAYCRLNDAIEGIQSRAQRPEHRAFAAHLVKVSQALHDIEWMLSGDTGPGDEIPAIMECISKTDALESAAESVRAAIKEGQEMLKMLEVK